MSVLELTRATGVTATAVRQRLVRLMRQELVRREVTKTQRGRPNHRYDLTEKARKVAGSNFSDLAIVLWEQLRAIQEPAVRRGLLSRIAQALASSYGGQISGETVEQRMESLTQLFAQRKVGVTVKPNSGSPTLTILDCPYPTLAERDRSVCAMEKMLFSNLLDQDVQLSQCRLDGHTCCEFAVA